MHITLITVLNSRKHQKTTDVADYRSSVMAMEMIQSSSIVAAVS